MLVVHDHISSQPLLLCMILGNPFLKENNLYTAIYICMPFAFPSTLLFLIDFCFLLLAIRMFRTISLFHNKKDKGFPQAPKTAVNGSITWYYNTGKREREKSLKQCWISQLPTRSWDFYNGKQRILQKCSHARYYIFRAAIYFLHPERHNHTSVAHLVLLGRGHTILQNISSTYVCATVFCVVETFVVKTFPNSWYLFSSIELQRALIMKSVLEGGIARVFSVPTSQHWP